MAADTELTAQNLALQRARTGAFRKVVFFWGQRISARGEIREQAPGAPRVPEQRERGQRDAQVAQRDRAGLEPGTAGPGPDRPGERECGEQRGPGPARDTPPRHAGAARAGAAAPRARAGGTLKSVAARPRSVSSTRSRPGPGSRHSPGPPPPGPGPRSVKLSHKAAILASSGSREN